LGVPPLRTSGGRAFATRFLASAFSRLLKELKQWLYPSRSSPPLPHCLCRFSGIASPRMRGKLRGKYLSICPQLPHDSPRCRPFRVSAGTLNNRPPLIPDSSRVATSLPHCLSRFSGISSLPHDFIVWQEHTLLRKFRFSNYQK
jgi:hypothetical protein